MTKRQLSYLSCMMFLLMMSYRVARSSDLNSHAVENWKELWVNAEKSLAEATKSWNNGFKRQSTDEWTEKRKALPSSDLSDVNRRIWIITTACLPWMTGTSINPLLRAAYLAKDREAGKVTLMVPWLPRDEQDVTFPAHLRFNHPDEQKEYVKNWLINTAKLPLAAERLDIRFYAGRYHDEYHSIFPMGDVSALIPDEEADVCIMEEPEHLNWYRAPFTSSKSWMEKFKHVVGIIHTNYLVYTRSVTGGAFKEPLVYYLNQGMVRAYCHKIIKLSGALQEFAPEKEVIANVHGVRAKYLEIGDDVAASSESFTKGAYFVGKLVWPKGLRELFKLMKYVKKRTGNNFPIDIYGQGPHQNEIQEYATQYNLPASFLGVKDHSELIEYKVFVNPSVSEVLCTTIVEALAMNKWVVCAKHPSNEFFEQFPNCLTFTNQEEFASALNWALAHDPKPLTPYQRYELSWEAATDRLLQASLITEYDKKMQWNLVNKFCGWALESLGTGSHGDMMRFIAGGKSASKQIEYIKQFGSALPQPDLISEKGDGEMSSESEHTGNNNKSGNSGKSDDSNTPISSTLPRQEMTISMSNSEACNSDSCANDETSPKTSSAGETAISPSTKTFQELTLTEKRTRAALAEAELDELLSEAETHPHW